MNIGYDRGRIHRNLVRSQAMARNLKFYFNENGSACARGPQSEKILMTFLETDVQSDDHICHDLMEDITAIEANAADSREFNGNAHNVNISQEGITITSQVDGTTAEAYTTGLKHFREILEDWEAFILDEDDT